MVEFTLQLFIFDFVTILAMSIATIYIYMRTRALYSLSLQKGIKYFSTAMLFYIIMNFLLLSKTLLDFFIDHTYLSFEKSIMGLILTFLGIFTAFMGGFYLAYSIIWRKFEKDRIKRFHFGRKLVFYLLAFLILAVDFYLVIVGIFLIPFLFYGLIIAILLYAIIPNYLKCYRQKNADINPFLSLVGIGFGVYILALIENLVLPYLFTIHFYVQVIRLVFVMTFVYFVARILR